MKPIIRGAQSTDGLAIADIYNHAVAHTTAIWNDTLVDAESRVQWIIARQEAGFPVIVSVDENDQVTGYATYGPWRPHDGYRHTVEHSVYVHPDHHGKGLGRGLVQALLARATEQRLHVMIAGIDAANAGSIRLHETLGFHASPPLPEVGTKFGRWLDLVFMWKKLDASGPR